MKKFLTCAAALCLSLVSCDQSPDPNRDYVSERLANLEALIDVKAQMAKKLSEVKDTATADAAAAELKRLDDSLTCICDRDAELGREMGRELYQKSEASVDEDMDARGQKAHDDVEKELRRLRENSFYGSDALRKLLAQ